MSLRAPAGSAAISSLNVGQASRLSILSKFQEPTSDIYKKEIKNV